ncbi:ABC transporter permease [Lysobacter korlensis]|uniref:ABC transporter permease n=1 Tax=Lysobacter korlensis TaxID=553636 RepID=A0ABV6RKA1_9GAMM
MTSLKMMLAVMRKELLDISRDRRTLALALLMGPLLYPVLMLGMGALGEKRAKTQLDKVLEVPVVGAEHAPNLMGYLATHGIKVVTPPAEIEAAIARQDVDVALEIHGDFADAWREGRPALVEIIQDTTRRDADIPVKRLKAALVSYGSQVGALRLLARGVAPQVAQPINVGTRDVATPEAKQGLILSTLLPLLLIFSAFLGGAYLILDATAGERERQSLEPLLATPAQRGSIVSGKIAAACVLGLLTLLLTLLAFKLSAQVATGTARMLDVSFPAIGKLLLILMPLVFIGTSLLTLIAASAKSMKEAQSHMTWLLLLPMFPTYFLAVNPLKMQAWHFAVPFLAQNQLIVHVIRAEVIDAQTWAIYVAAGLGLAALLWFAAVYRYRQERVAISG